MIWFNCPGCQASLRHPRGNVWICCPHCQQRLRVPPASVGTAVLPSRPPAGVPATQPGHWYVTRDGQDRFGPYSRTQLVDLARQGELLPSDKLWTDGQIGWQMAALSPDLFPPPDLRAPLPDFEYSIIPGAFGRRLRFGVEVSGAVAANKEDTRMYITGGGGGGTVYSTSPGQTYGHTASTWIDTRYETTTSAIILDPVRGEASFRRKGEYQLAPGDHVTVVSAVSEANQVVGRCLLLNHTRKAWYYLGDGACSIWPGVWETLLGLVCLLLALVAGIGLVHPAPYSSRFLFGVGVVLGGLGLALIGASTLAARYRMEKHAQQLADMLL